MTVPVWVAELAADFWKEVGWLEPFPRNLRRPIARAVRVTVVFLPRLTIHKVLRWLFEWGIVCEFGECRSLRACLVARNGFGFIFVDGSDSDAEQRFSLAHELAHFLRHYWHPRQRAEKRLGSQVLQVLDGQRPPTRQERVHALLHDVNLGFHVHLLQRDDDGNPATREIVEAEDDADGLAYELLAPAHLILSSCVNARTSSSAQVLEKSLREVYGLPSCQAAEYARRLLPRRFKDPLLRKLSKVV